LKANYAGTLGVLGGIIDVVVGFLLLQGGMMATQMEPTTMSGAMGFSSVTNLTAGTLLVALGVVVFVTGVYSFGQLSIPRMRTIGGLMLVYGILMLLIGLSMFYGFGRMIMQAGFISGSLMLIVGVLMITSGSSMLRQKPMM
jgi:hypothetical protein